MLPTTLLSSGEIGVFDSILKRFVTILVCAMLTMSPSVASPNVPYIESENCYQFQFVSLNVSTDHVDIGKPMSTLITVWKQGDKIRIEDEHGNRVIKNSLEVVYCNSRGERYRSKSDSREMLIVGGGFEFLAIVVFLDSPFPKTKPLKEEVIANERNGMFRIEDLFESVFEKGPLRGCVWVPLKRVENQNFFSVLQLYLGNRVIEVRQLSKGLSLDADEKMFYFTLCKDAKEISEDELVSFAAKRFAIQQDQN